MPDVKPQPARMCESAEPLVESALRARSAAPGNAQRLRHSAEAQPTEWRVYAPGGHDEHNAPEYPLITLEYPCGVAKGRTETR